MSLSRFRQVTARIREWDSRQRDWSKRDWPKRGRKRDRDRDAFSKQIGWVRGGTVALLVAWASWVSWLGITPDMVTLAGPLIGLCLLVINPCGLVRPFADLARFARQLAALDLPPMARLRRSASAAQRAIEATEARARARFGLARQVAHRLAASQRAAVGSTVLAVHPRIAASLAAASAAPQRS